MVWELHRRPRLVHPAAWLRYTDHGCSSCDNSSLEHSPCSCLSVQLQQSHGAALARKVKNCFGAGLGP